MFRTLTAAIVGTLALTAFAAGPGYADDGGMSAAQANTWVHGLSLIGAPKYPADFKHYDYVNPDAPKGGVVRFSVTGTFDSLNAIIEKGNPAVGLDRKSTRLNSSH